MTLTRRQQIEALEKDWATNPRWKNVKRTYTAEEVVSLRGSVVPANTIAQPWCRQTVGTGEWFSEKRVCELFGRTHWRPSGATSQGGH